MRRKKGTDSEPVSRRQDRPQRPDCTTCIYRWGCDCYEEDSFCGRWQSKAPELSGIDPNKLWEQGEEVDF